MSQQDTIHQAGLALREFIADFMCFLDRDNSSSVEEDFEQNLLVADLLLQSLGCEITDAQNDGAIVAKLSIGLS